VSRIRIVCLAALVVAAGCGRKPQLKVTGSSGRGSTGVAPVELAKVEAKPGVAVVVLVDTSGSMAQKVPDASGQMRPKNELAREALERIVAQTDDWKKKKPDQTLKMGVTLFASSVRDLLPVGDFDAAAARAALNRLPHPNSGTAIGKAMEHGFQALYGTGCTRKYLVCITDGENTVGVRPDRMAKQLFDQTGGEVEIHFIAFDTASRHFAFLKEVNGNVVEASDGKQLAEELSKIYDKRILAEKPEP